MKTKGTISLICLWKLLLLLNPLCNEETFFYMGFFNSWPCLTLRMRWCDFCLLHETWQFAMAFELILANFQSGPTYKQGAERAWKFLPGVCGSPIQNRSKMTSRAHVLTGCHENSDPVMLLNFRDFTIQFWPWKRAIIEHYYRLGIYTSARPSGSRYHRILRAQTYDVTPMSHVKSKIITLFNSSTCVIY